MYRLPELVAEILRGLEKGRPHWPKLVSRLGPKFEEKWGEAWKNMKFPEDLDVD
jgi:hypothetical protein